MPYYITPDFVNIERCAQEERKKLLSTAKKQGSTINERSTTIQFCINIAKASSLSSSHYGDAQLLANTVSCSRQFATKVLKMVEEGKEDSLFQSSRRIDSILATDWPDRLETFVLNPENSRAVPGKEQVSIRYGKRHTKFLLLKPKYTIIKEFKEANPDCKFKTSTLMREFPPYAVKPTSRDIQRNTCPYHANMRHLISALNRVLKSRDQPLYPTSCRQLVMKYMCPSDFADIDPLSWKEECAMGECQRCQTIKVNITKKLLDLEITFSQWETREQLVRKRGKMVKKNIFSLFSRTTTVGEARDLLVERLPKLRKHIYVAHQQWNAHATLRENLDKSSVITIEDYQMNITLKFAEQPTTSGYS